MVALVIDAFAGMVPRTAPGLLKPDQAQLALDCKITSGELRALMQPLAIMPSPNTGGTVVSMYRMGLNVPDDDKYWLTFTQDTDVALTPIFSDGAERTYLMDGVQAKMTDNALALSGSLYPAATLNLGVPNPELAPVVTVQSSACYVTLVKATGANNTLIVTCPGHPFAGGDSVRLFGSTDAALNADFGACTYIDPNTFSVTSVVPLTIPPTLGSIMADFSAVAPLTETRSYVYTYVSGRGEESGPSPATIVSVSNPAQTSVVTGLGTAPPSGAYDIRTKRLYRTSTGTSGSTIYLFVVELPITQDSYTDLIPDTGLGEVMPSLTWLPPPATARGLLSGANGLMACFSGNDFYLCEPFRPHAWPIQYALSTDYPIVALGYYLQNWVVTTEAHPYIVTGTDPQSMTMIRMELNQANLSKRSTVNVSGSVIYAGNDGLVVVGTQGARIATEPFMTHDEWHQLNPASIQGYRWANRYVGFYTGATLPNVPATGGFIFDPDNKSLSFVDVYATAGYADLAHDALYLMINNEIVKWDAGTTPFTYTWRSKLFSAPLPLNPAAAQVDCASYPVNFALYADGNLVSSQTVTSPEGFRLPGGYLARNFEIVLTGTVNVRKVIVGETMDELKKA